MLAWHFASVRSTGCCRCCRGPRPGDPAWSSSISTARRSPDLDPGRGRAPAWLNWFPPRPPVNPPCWRSISCSQARIGFRRMATQRWRRLCRQFHRCLGSSWKQRIPGRTCPQRRSCPARRSQCPACGGPTASLARSLCSPTSRKARRSVVAADPDGPIRRVPLMVMAGNVVRPGLAVETVRLAQGAGALLIDPGNADRRRPCSAAWRRYVARFWGSRPRP